MADTEAGAAAWDWASEIAKTHERIKPYARQTPLDTAFWLSDHLNARVLFKCEHLQHTGSFKLRGALNKVLSLDDEQRRRGVVAASTGNHGMAVAYAARLLGGVRARVFVPEGADATKVHGISLLGAETLTYGANCLDAEVHARAVADAEGVAYLSPYNDRLVVCGQGTIGLELLEQAAVLGASVDYVLASVGGGGLLGGIAAFVKVKQPQVRVIACQPSASHVMLECVKAGRVVDFPEHDTLSSATAGGVEHGAVTLPLMQYLVDEFVLVDEHEIADAMRLLIEHEHLMVEGAAAVAVAAALRMREQLRGKTVAIILCGRNVPIHIVRRILGTDNA